MQAATLPQRTIDHHSTAHKLPKDWLAQAAAVGNLLE
jgi:hypothetical protein